MGTVFIALETELAQARETIAGLEARVADLEARLTLADLRYRKLDECNVRIGAELQSTLSKLGVMARGKSETPYGGEGTA